MIDPKDITPGVYEVRSPDGCKYMASVSWEDPKHDALKVLWLSISGSPHSRSLATALLDRWQFTARYIRSTAEPVECWRAVFPGDAGLYMLSSRQSAEQMRAEERESCDIVRGVFIQTEE